MNNDWTQSCITLSNTLHSEVAPCLPLPSLPPFCGASDEQLRLFDDRLARPLDRREILSQAPKIADLLLNTDVSYLTVKNDASSGSGSKVSHMDLCDEVLRFSRDAFECTPPGPLEERISNVESGRNVYPKKEHTSCQVEGGPGESHNHQHAHVVIDDVPSSSKKSRVKKKGSQGVSSSALPDLTEQRDAMIRRFCDFLEEFCSRAEIPGEERDESEWLLLSTSDIRMVMKEILSIQEEKLLHQIPVDFLVRLLKVLDHQIHRAEGLSIDECENSDSDVETILCALESIHAALGVMALNDMPKQLYKEEIIERILEFTRRQIMDVMSACDPSYRALHRPGDTRVAEGEDDPDAEAEFGSASKRRRTTKSVKVKRTMANRIPAAVNSVFQKLCTILGLLKDLLLVERLSDSCILQLVKTCLSTFLVDNIQLLQMKAMSLISGIFYSYAQHRSYIVDEVIQLLWKLPFSKRAARSYHLPDEEQKQIQMITALLLQLVLHSANLPEALRQTSNNSAIFETKIETNYLIKCNEAATEACVSFWTHVLQRLTNKGQEASEVKVIMENLVVDLLTALNLPEYPAASLILEVLCVLLLQNAGPKSKDVSIRSLAIDILGTIAARLKQESVLCHRDNFWIVQELAGGENVNENDQTDTCSVCLDEVVERALVICQGCQRPFHPDCIGVRDDISTRGWQCPCCLCRKQLLVLQSYCKSQFKDDNKNNHNRSENLPDESASKMEIVQQMLLNYLEDMGSSDDFHLFARWLYLCLWYKDDPNSQQQLSYRLARLKSKAVIRDSGALSSLLTRDYIKKITLCLGQHNSFSRGFDTILGMLLVSLRDNSPIIRAKALRAVSIIVEADPDVLRDNRIQVAVEGRFCDSAISVREAALELVGRHIASHPDVGVQYFQKVAERIKDTGVSVRKRAIKIIRDMCTSNADFVESANACIEIISRISDEESSIQDLVCKTFYEFWFEEPAGRQYFGGDSSVPLEVARKTEQIVDMLKKMPNHQPLVTVIKRNLALDFLPQSKGIGVNSVLLATVRKRCEMMCKFSLERILQVEEMNTEEGESRILPYVTVLHAFCVVDPSLCAPASNPSQFVVTLQPYLKNQVDNRAMAQLLESIIFIIDVVLPLLRKLPQSVVEELEQDLKQMIVRHSFLTVVHACIKCLCSLNKIAGGKGARLIQFLIQVFVKRLDALGVENKQQVGRSLFCLGLLIRYGSSLLSDTNEGFDISSSISLFKKYLLADDFGIKARALQALGFVLIARPEYMLEEDTKKILAATLSSSCDARLKLQALQNMYDYLLDAESQLGSDTVEDNVVDYSQDGGSVVPVAAGAGDTNICGGIVQLYWESILERCLDMNEQIRQSGLKIVEVALRQGLVHPITCVACLIALETDPLEMNSKLAHHLLMNMNEKYPAFFESRLGDGLELSFNFMRSISGNSFNSNSKNQSKVAENLKGKSEDGSFAYARVGVTRIYKLIRGNRLSRNKFMSSVIRKFDNPCWSETVVPFLMYCTEILALLPFTIPDEPLYLVYTINRVIQVRSGTLEASLKAFSSHFSQRSLQKDQPENGNIWQEFPGGPLPASVSSDLNGQVHFPEDGHCMAMDENVHTRTAGPRLLTEDDQQRMQAVCLAATAIQLLLRLKRHLKIVYNLDDVRCQAFSPAEPPKSGEPLSKQNIPFSIGVVNTSLPSTSEELTQRYQEFKNALREDTVDYSAYTANIKRKRPPSRRGGKSSRMNGREDEDYDEDDEDCTGGRRNYSGRQSNGIRASRRL